MNSKQYFDGFVCEMTRKKNLKPIQFFIMDEADRLLDLGCEPHLTHCTHYMFLESQLPHKIVNLLFQIVN